MIKQKGLPASAMLWQAGQTLLEILLAFSVSILVLSAIVIGITTSLSNTQYAKNQNLANYYAKEAMAVVKQVRDSSWTNFSSKIQPMYCLSQNSTILTEPNPPLINCGQNVGIFSREINFAHSSSDCSNGKISGSKVTIKVSWSDNKCPIGTPICHKVELITCFSNIDQKQEP